MVVVIEETKDESYLIPSGILLSTILYTYVPNSSLASTLDQKRLWTPLALQQGPDIIFCFPYKYVLCTFETTINGRQIPGLCSKLIRL